MHIWGNKLTVLTDLNEIKECKRHDGEGDSDRRVLISGISGSWKDKRRWTHGTQTALRSFSHNKKSILETCNATNMSLMKIKWAVWQQQGLSSISKRISVVNLIQLHNRSFWKHVLLGYMQQEGL